MIEGCQPRNLYVSTGVEGDGQIRRLAANTANVDGVKGFVITANNVITYGLDYLVDNIAPFYPDKTLVYDHLAAGTDIAANANGFMKSVQKSRVHKVVVYPSIDLQDAESWIKSGQDQQLDVIVGKELTQDKSPKNPNAYDKLLQLAVKLGIREFMLPGNKPARLEHYRKLIEGELGTEAYSVFALGFGIQGGSVENFARAVGHKPGWNLIVGRDIFTNPRPGEKAVEYVQEMDNTRLLNFFGH